jgi:hypothetical protein
MNKYGKYDEDSRGYNDVKNKPNNYVGFGSKCNVASTLSCCQIAILVFWTSLVNLFLAK